MRGLERGVAVLVAIGVIGCARNHAPPRAIAPRYEGPIQSRDVVEGGRIYITLCTACHRGRVNPRGYSWSPGQMRHQIREGNRLMPPLSDELLSDAQVEAVVAYLAVMGALEGELPPIRPSDEGLDLDPEDPADLIDEELDEPEEERPAYAEASGASAATDAVPTEPPAEEPPPTPVETESAPLEPHDPWGETGVGLAPPGGSEARPVEVEAAAVPAPLVGGTRVGDATLLAEAMTFVFSNLGDGSEHRLRIRIEPGEPVSLRFRGLEVGRARVLARRWRVADGEWVAGSEPLTVDEAATLEVQLAQPVRGSGGPLEAHLLVDGRPVALPVPTRTAHETVEPI